MKIVAFYLTVRYKEFRLLLSGKCARTHPDPP